MDAVNNGGMLGVVFLYRLSYFFLKYLKTGGLDDIFCLFNKDNKPKKAKAILKELKVTLEAWRNNFSWYSLLIIAEREISLWSKEQKEWHFTRMQ